MCSLAVQFHHQIKEIKEINTGKAYFTGTRKHMYRKS